MADLLRSTVADVDTLSIDDERPEPLRVAGAVIGGRIGVDFQPSISQIQYVANSCLTIELANGAALTFDDFWTKGRLVFLQVSAATLNLTVRGVRVRGPIAPMIAKLVERDVRCVSRSEFVYLPFCATELLAHGDRIRRIGFYESDDYVRANTNHYAVPVVRSESEQALLRQRLIDNYDHEQFMHRFHFSTALRNGDLDSALRLIVEGGPGISVSEALRNLDPGSTSPATIEFLINAGANPDLRNSNGFTFREIVHWTYEYEHDFVELNHRRIPEVIFALVR